MSRDGLMLAALAAMSAFAAGEAAAQESRWAYVGSSASGSTYFDTQTIERTNGIAEAWFREESKGASSYVTERTRYRFDCPNRKIGTVSTISYSVTGAVKSSYDPAYVAMHAVVPETTGENAWAISCPEEAAPLGLQQVGALGRELRRDDPEFHAKFEQMQPFIRWAQANLPATLWARAIRDEWEKLP